VGGVVLVGDGATNVDRELVAPEVFSCCWCRQPS